MKEDDDKFLQWIVDNQDVIKIYKVEKKLSLPEGTLKKFVDGNRELPKNHYKKIIEWVKKTTTV